MEEHANHSSQPLHKPAVSLPQMFAFFIPLGLAQSLVTISHVIINGTLNRADNPEAVIASFALAMSLLGMHALSQYYIVKRVDSGHRKIFPSTGRSCIPR